MTGQALLGNSEALGLRFDSHQDALDYLAKTRQDSEDWLALYDGNFIDRYKRKEIEIVIPCSIGNLNRAEPDYYHLIVSAVPFMRIGHGERPPESSNSDLSSPHDSLHRGKEFVFVPVTQFIQCPQEVVASSVRLEPAKQRLDLFREIGGLPNRTGHVSDILSKGERGIPSIRLTSRNGDSVASVVQGTAQINNNVASEIAERFWERLDEFYLVNLPSRIMRIGLDNLCVWIESMELPESPVEIGPQCFLSPCKIAFRASEGV